MFPNYRNMMISVQPAKKILSLGLPLLAASVFCTSLMAHPGSLDENGGHYNGGSYHCHLGACEQPDTFFRTGRDSFFFDPNSRSKFFNEDDWPTDEDFDGDCQQTRTEILVATSRAPVRYTNPRNCEVRTGEWLDEYTGKLFTVAAQIDLDHIVPLRYAHNVGGDRWPPNKKVAFANDPMNLLLSERSEIRKKGDKGPSQYLPREEYQCDYARQWEAIAEKYEIRLVNRDKNKIASILKDCSQD